MGLLGNLVEVARAAVEGILNGVWQGILFVAVVAILIRGLRGAGPTARHLIWLTALGAVVGLTVLAASDRLAGEAALAGSGNGATVMVPGSLPADPSASGIANRPILAPGRALVVNVSQAEWLLVIVLLLASVSALKVVWLGLGYARWHSFRAGAEPLPSEFERVIGAIPLAYFRRNPAIRISDELSRPITMGFLRPMILLPRALSANLTQLELKQIVLHELAHVRRYDDWTNLFQRLLESIFYFNPAVGWIGRRLEIEREIACDEQVVAHLGGKSSYATCLIKLAASTWPVRGSQYVAGAASTRSQLARRVEAIVAKGGHSGGWHPALALTGGAAVLALAFLMTSQGPAVRVALAERVQASRYAESNPAPLNRSTGPLVAGLDSSVSSMFGVDSGITGEIRDQLLSELAQGSAGVGRPGLPPTQESIDPEDTGAQHRTAVGTVELGHRVTPSGAEGSAPRPGRRSAEDLTPRMAATDCGLAASTSRCIDRGLPAALVGTRPILTLAEVRETKPPVVATAGLDERRDGLKVISSGGQRGPSYGKGASWRTGTVTPSSLGYSVGGLPNSAAPTLPAVLRAPRTSTAWGLLSGVQTDQ